MWSKQECRGGSNARPPSRGPVRDFGREESAKQQRLSEQVQRLAKLCIPIPDTAVRPQSGALLGGELGRQTRSRSPLPQDPRRRLSPALTAAAGPELQLPANQAMLPSPAPVAPAGALAANKASPQAPNAYDQILRTCSLFLGLLAKDRADRRQRRSPRTEDLIRADLRHQDSANDLVAQVILACRNHDEAHGTTLATLLQQDLDDVSRGRARMGQSRPMCLDDAATEAVSHTHHTAIRAAPRAELAGRPTQQRLEETLASLTPVPQPAWRPLRFPSSEGPPDPCKCPGESSQPARKCWGLGTEHPLHTSAPLLRNPFSWSPQRS